MGYVLASGSSDLDNAQNERAPTIRFSTSRRLLARTPPGLGELRITENRLFDWIFDTRLKSTFAIRLSVGILDHCAIGMQVIAQDVTGLERDARYYWLVNSGKERQSRSKTSQVLLQLGRLTRFPKFNHTLSRTMIGIRRHSSGQQYHPQRQDSATNYTIDMGF
jgi:hypothetical protein